MFESAELGHAVDKKRWDKEAPKLRDALLAAQLKVGEARRFPVLILIAGVEGAGKGETVNLLNAWMDPRHILTQGFGKPTEEEALRPPMWRYWKALPPRGKVGIFFGSWYTPAIVAHVLGRSSRADLAGAVGRIRHLEQMLHREGVLILKFWFHLSKARQKKRLKSLEKDEQTRWRVSAREWDFFKKYDRFREVSEHVLRETNTAEAPWIVVEGEDRRYRSLTVGKVLLEAMEKRLLRTTHDATSAAPMVEVLDNRKLLRDVDLTQKLDQARYDARLEVAQGKLNRLSRSKRFKKRSLLLVFEGCDAAGKGGAIRRVTAALDARHYRIIPVAKPTDEEYAQPYLWRFWRHAPAAGGVTIFDRSWYGRVLVERVEGFCREPDWMRAYDEINAFEEQMANNGTIICKFWLHISQEEQLRRFKERERTSWKRFKITEEDWRNRKKWDQYEAAVCDMLDRTSNALAPWTIVEAEDKNFGRLKVLKTIVERVKDALDSR